MLAAAAPVAYKVATNPYTWQAARSVASSSSKLYRYYKNQPSKPAAKSSRGNAAPIASGYSRKKFMQNRAKLRKKYKPRSNAKLTRDVARLKAATRQLKFSDESSNGTMTYRLWTTHTLRCPENEHKFEAYDGFSVTNLETALANLKYYDPSNPATLVVADATTGSYQKQVHFKSITASLTLRNNYQSDCDVVIYLCSPKDDTSISASTAWANGLTDGANVSFTDPATYPNDFTQFTEIWKAKRIQSSVLSPGQTVKVSHTSRDIMYDPSVKDEHSLAYQKSFGSFQFLVVIKGVISHDTTQAAQQGLEACGLDILRKRTCIVNYDAGIGLQFVHSDTSALDSPTAGFVQSHQPVPDNIGYSIT